MSDLLVTLACTVPGLIMALAEFVEESTYARPKRKRQSSRKRRPRSPRSPAAKPRFTGNVIVLSEYKGRIKSKTGGNPATA
jgi:hypothetical protein